ncbi:hypothetical protein BH18GEM1_BH18GEM1_18800 [soil metagenome]
MKVSSIEAIVAALARTEVRYLVAGGIAVNAHGYVRLTDDVDIVVHLDPTNLLRAWSALEELGYRPTVPVRAEDFADSATRQRWIREKGMQVLRLWSDLHRETPVDIFVAEPFDFETEYAHSYSAELSPGLTVPFVRLEALIRMKEQVGRPRDLDDVQHLRWILEDRER